MNKTIMKLAIAGLTCVTLFGTACAAPKGNHRGNAGHPARAVQRTTRTVVKAPPAPARHATTPRHAAKPPVHNTVAHCRPAHHPAPNRHCRPHRRHIPHGARYWARPPVPCWRIGALRPWEWVVQEWVIIVNGVYYYGDGYYFDGCNYFYNGTYHTTPPTVVIIT